MELNEDNVKVILNDGSSMGRKLYGSIEIAVAKESHFNRDETKADRIRKETEEVRDDIVEAIRLYHSMKDLEKTLGDELDSHEDIDFGRDNGLWEMEKKFRLITELLELVKK